MADDRTASILLDIEIQKRNADQARKSLATIQKDINAVSAAQKESTTASQQFAAALVRNAKAIDRVGDNSQKLNKTLKGSTSQIKGLTTSLTKGEQQAAAFNRQLREMQKQSKETRSTLGQLEDVTGSFGGALGTIGRQRAGAILPGGENIVAAAETLPELFGALNAIPEAVLAARASLSGLSVSIGAVTLTMGPLIVLFGGLALGAKLLSDEIEKGKSRMEEAVASRTAEITAIKSLTSVEIKERIDTLETEQEIQHQLANDFKNAQRNIGKFLGTFTGVNKQLKEAEQASSASAAEIEALNRALNDTEVAARDAAAAQEEFLATQIAMIQERAKFEQRVDDIIEEGSRQQLDAEIKAIETRKGEIEKELKALRELDDQGDEVADQIATLREELDKLTERGELLNSSEVQDAVDAREAEKEALKDATDAEEARTKAIEKSTKDIERIQTQAAQRQIAIETRLADRLIDIAIRAAQAEEDAAIREGQRLSDLRRDQAQAEVDARRDFAIARQEAIVDAQRDEAKSARDHVRSLKKIRADAEASEFEAALTGDFAAIAASRRQTRRQLQEESENFRNERRERQIELRQELQDNAEAFLREREQRMIENERRLQELKIQAEREEAQRKKAVQRQIDAANRAAQRELERLTEKLNTELRLKQEAFNAELKLLTSFVTNANALANQQKQQVEASGPVASGLHEQGAFGGGRAGGGPLGIGQSARVNELGTESVIGGGGRFSLPVGPGIFTATQPSRIIPATDGGASISMSFVVNESENAEQTAIMIDRKVANTLNRIFS